MLKYLWVLVTVICNILVAYFFSCASENKIIFFENTFSDVTKTWLLNHSLLFIIILGFLMGANHFLSLFVTKHTKREQIILDNICHHVFDNYIKTNPTLRKQHVRVSLLKVMNGLHFLQCKPDIGVFMKVVGRYQLRQPKHDCSIKFIPGEGCVGLCYQTNAIMYKELPDPKTKKYMDACVRELNLSEKKVAKLNNKQRAYLCLPIRKFNSDEVFAILSIDSDQISMNNNLSSDKIREIESLINSYTPFFDSKNDGI